MEITLLLLTISFADVRADSSSLLCLPIVRGEAFRLAKRGHSGRGMRATDGPIEEQAAALRSQWQHLFSPLTSSGWRMPLIAVDVVVGNKAGNANWLRRVLLSSRGRKQLLGPRVPDVVLRIRSEITTSMPRGVLRSIEWARNQLSPADRAAPHALLLLRPDLFIKQPVCLHAASHAPFAPSNVLALFPHKGHSPTMHQPVNATPTHHLVNDMLFFVPPRTVSAFMRAVDAGSKRAELHSLPQLLAQHASSTDEVANVTVASYLATLHDSSPLKDFNPLYELIGRNIKKKPRAALGPLAFGAHGGGARRYAREDRRRSSHTPRRARTHVHTDASAERLAGWATLLRRAACAPSGSPPTLSLST